MALAARLRVAVIGGGISGIAAARSLDADHDVTLFEADPRLGGHAHTVDVDDGAGQPIAVDTAFLVYNALHYPAFVRLVEELGVAPRTRPADMSASFVDDDHDMRFALLRGARSLVAQKRNLLRPGFYRMFVELLALRRRARLDLKGERISADTTLLEYLSPYSDLLRDRLVFPLASAVWSLPNEQIGRYPASAILSFFENHGLLSGSSGDAWRTFVGGSVVYVRAFRDAFRGTIRLGAPVLGVERRDGSVHLTLRDGVASFDRVVAATHADVALKLLSDPSGFERTTLGAFSYHDTRVSLHSDPRVLHPDRRVWASWNAVTRRGRSRITYHLNRVQALSSRKDWFVTLDADDGDREIAADKVARTFAYRHPAFDAPAIAAQAALAAHEGDRGIFFCGSYAGHGFHEDGVVSGQRAAALAARPAPV